jgi:hypothetical protein
LWPPWAAGPSPTASLTVLDRVHHQIHPTIPSPNLHRFHKSHADARSSRLGFFPKSPMPLRCCSGGGAAGPSRRIPAKHPADFRRSSIWPTIADPPPSHSSAVLTCSRTGAKLPVETGRPGRVVLLDRDPCPSTCSSPWETRRLPSRPSLCARCLLRPDS